MRRTHELHRDSAWDLVLAVMQRDREFAKCAYRDLQENDNYAVYLEAVRVFNRNQNKALRAYGVARIQDIFTKFDGIPKERFQEMIRHERDVLESVNSWGDPVLIRWALNQFTWTLRLADFRLTLAKLFRIS